MSEWKIHCMQVGDLDTNCYLVYQDILTEKEELRKGVIIDPGDDAYYILNRCKELAAEPAAVLLTHGHGDHIMAAEDICKAFHIPLLAGEKEEALLADAEANLSCHFGHPTALKADRLLKDGETFELLGRTWQVLFTPGHTPGGVCFYVAEEGVLFSGDTLFSRSVGRTDFPGGDLHALVASVYDKLFVLPDETVVYPGHGEYTSIAFEKKYNMISHARR